MAILVNKNTNVLIQGITGSVGKVYAERMIEHGTRIVAGVTPGKGGQNILGIPVYNSVDEAVSSHSIDCSLVVVPAPYVKEALMESVDSGIKLVTVYTEGVPVHDSSYAIQYSKLTDTRIIGPNSAGVVTPGECNVSDINDTFLKKGNIGIASRSGTMTYEAMEGLFEYGLGVSTVSCLGGDPIVGTRHIDVLKLFEDDDDTSAVILLGELGGADEIAAASYIKSMSKPVFAYVSGWSTPPGKKMGHAGAIASGESESALAKSKVLEKEGAFTAKTVKELTKIIGQKL